MYTLRKTSVLTVALALVLALLFGAFALTSGRTAGAETDGPEVLPELIENNNNPTCADQGYAHELKIESIDLDNKAYSDGILNVTISDLQYNSDSPPEAVQFNWASNIGVDAVLVKASNTANAYIYDPPAESTGDDGLIAPENKGISHISFCYDLNLQVEKTANTSLKRTHTWTIDKSADKDKETLPVGGTSPVKYSVKVDETSKDSDWKVDGTIKVTAPVDATVTSVTDTVSQGIAATVKDCSKTLPAALSAGESLTCTYSANLPDATTRTNTATATSGTDGVEDGTGTAEVNFANATVTETDEQIDVKDSLQGNLGTTTADKTFYYTRNVGPYEQCGNYEVPNTASFTTNDTGAKGEDSWNVDVTVLCKVTVKKTTDGVVNPNTMINFTLTGPGLPSGGISRNTSGDADGVLDFGYSLVPGETYTVCENPVPAGFTSFWKLDGVIVSPYNPGDSKVPKEDIGVRCYDFTASAGKTPAFEIDNSHPGGDPRTIGYWKNWNTCTGGNQATTAAKNGGAAAGVFLLNDLLPQTIGDLILPKSATGCQQAVKILSKQNLSGQNKASDAAYELASQLLAAKVNKAAGAETCSSVDTAIMNGQALLANGPTDTPKGVNFNGTGSYLPSNTTLTTLRTQALTLAATLDKYNNGDLC
jgi:hypothetical protein